MENLAAARSAVRAYVALSVATLVALVILQIRHPELAGTAAWVRGTIVAATSLLMLRFAGQAVAGEVRALLRWRIVVVVVLVALVAVVLVPGLIPVWMRVEQVVCGIILVRVAVLIFRRPPR